MRGGWDSGFLANLGAGGPKAPGQGSAAGVVERCSALDSAESGDVVAEFVEESAAHEAGIGATPALGVGSVLQGERASARRK